MKTSSKKRYAFAAILSAAGIAKAWVAVALAIVIIILAYGSITYAVYRKLVPQPPPPNDPPPVNNNVHIVFGVEELYEYPYWPVMPPFYPPLFVESGDLGKTFSFQYGMGSTNPVAQVWIAPGTNLTTTIFWPMDDPSGIGNPRWQLTNQVGYVYDSVMWTNIDTEDCFDFIYQCGGWLRHYNATNINGSYVIVNTNLTLVIARSTNLTDWEPIFTNQTPGLDVPYTFTDNSAFPNAFYRAGYQ
jgi:hypothetical protein